MDAFKKERKKGKALPLQNSRLAMAVTRSVLLTDWCWLLDISALSTEKNGTATYR